MPTIDTSALATRLLQGAPGAREEVERSFGVELPAHHFSMLRRLAKEHGDEARGLGIVLSLLSRFAHATDDLLYERHELRRALVHDLIVRWDDAGTGRVTIGVAKTYARSITEAWPELEPWSRTLEKNRERLNAWARKSSGATVTLKARPVEAVASADDEAMLRAAIIADPDADEPRLVYADWLMERGDVRGELIRLQCAAPSFESRQRINEILSANWTTLAGPAATFTTQASFDRGFVDRVTMTIAAFLKHGEALFSTEPIRSWRVDNPKFTDRELERLGRAPAMERVRRLELAQLNPDAKPRRPLAALAIGQRPGLSAGDRDHPDAGAGAVVLDRGGRDGVGHHRPVRRWLRIADRRSRDVFVDTNRVRVLGEERGGAEEEEGGEAAKQGHSMMPPPSTCPSAA